MVQRQRYLNSGSSNRGFSLVEVLVCIALLAIICIPLFAGFRTSAILNNKAHYTQKVTAYAQEELETIKSLSVENYTKTFIAGGTDAEGITYSYITSGDEWDDLNTRAQQVRAHFNPGVTLTAEEEAALFRPFICEKKDIAIGSKTYTMHARFMPAEYSQYNDRDSAAGVNVAGYFDIAQADAVRFPVIADEINLYDATCVDILLDKLKVAGIKGKTDADILGNMKKKIDVKIESSTADAEVEVRCDVTYSYPADAAPLVETSYCVYKASYELAPTVPADGLKVGAESGGSVFIMAYAFKAETKNQCVNELTINSTGDTDIYFVLGHMDGSDAIFNFDRITVNAAPYVDSYNVKADVPGEMDIPGTNGIFRTNIKANGSVLNDSEKYQTIGGESYKTITYAVEIDLYEQADENKRAAHIEATKIDR